MTRKAEKGRAIANHLTNNVMEDYKPLNFYFPDENVLTIEEYGDMNDWWTMYFNEAVNISGNGDGAVIISLEKKQYHVLVGLQFECTNNTTKYEACIVNLQAALKLEVEKFDVYRDSILPGEGGMTN
jgi:hypothetical protein